MVGVATGNYLIPYKEKTNQNSGIDLFLSYCYNKIKELSIKNKNSSYNFSSTRFFANSVNSSSYNEMIELEELISMDTSILENTIDMKIYNKIEIDDRKFEFFCDFNVSIKKSVLFEAHNSVLDITGYGNTTEEAIQDLKEWVADIWDRYALSGDEELSDDAIEYKKLIKRTYIEIK